MVLHHFFTLLLFLIKCKIASIWTDIEYTTLKDMFECSMLSQELSNV